MIDVESRAGSAWLAVVKAAESITGENFELRPIAIAG